MCYDHSALVIHLFPSAIPRDLINSMLLTLTCVISLALDPLTYHIMHLTLYYLAWHSLSRDMMLGGFVRDLFLPRLYYLRRYSLISWIVDYFIMARSIILSFVETCFLLSWTWMIILLLLDTVFPSSMECYHFSPE